MERTIWWQNDDASIQNHSVSASTISQRGFVHVTDRGQRLTVGPSGLAAEGGEVVGADERITRQAQAVQVERRLHPPGGALAERVGHGRAADRVPVAPAAGVEAGREPVGHDLGFAHGDGGTAQRVHRPHQPLEIDAGGGGEVDHLAVGVDTGVRATGAGELDLVAQHPFEGLDEGAADRRHAGIGGEAVEARALVGHGHPDASQRRRRGRVEFLGIEQRRRAHRRTAPTPGQEPAGAAERTATRKLLDELDTGHRRVVAVAGTELEDAGVATGTVDVAGPDLGR